MRRIIIKPAKKEDNIENTDSENDEEIDEEIKANPNEDPEYLRTRAKTDRKFRKKGLKVILNILKDELSDKLPTDQTPEYIAKEIERGCNNKAVRKAIADKIKPRWWTNVLYCEIYSAIVYKVSMNLSPKSEVGSETLINMISNKTVKLSSIADMHSNAMCPEKCNKIIKEMNVRLKEKVEYKITNRYQCPNCQKNKAKRREVQLRSLDEGSNISLECVYCAYEWII